MKKYTISILIMFIFIFTGCNNIYLNDNKTPIHKKWFSSESQTVAKEYIGRVFEAEMKKISRDDLIALISNPISFTKWELMTNNGWLINYQFEDIDYFQESLECEVNYYNLKEDFSSDTFYTKFSNGSASIVIDYKKNVLVILKNGLNKKTIVNAYKFNDNYKLKDLTFVGGYEENQNYYIAFIDKDNIIYVVDVKTMQAVKTRTLEENKFISAYAESEEGSELKGIFLYLLNEKDNKLIKMQIPHDKVIYEKTLDKRIVGDVKQIEPEGMGEILILTKMTNNYVIYTTNEDDFKIIFAKKLNSEKTNYKNIDAINYYFQNEKNIFVILLDKKSEIPISKIEYLDLSWEEIE